MLVVTYFLWSRGLPAMAPCLVSSHVSSVQEEITCWGTPIELQWLLCGQVTAFALVILVLLHTVYDPRQANQCFYSAGLPPYYCPNGLEKRPNTKTNLPAS